MPASTLYRHEPVFTLDNIHELLPEGLREIITDGNERRVMGLERTNSGERHRAATPTLAAAMAVIDPSEYDARIDEQIKLQQRVSDYCTWDQFYQNGLPTCWSINTAQAASTKRVIEGQPFIRLTGVSAAVEISGGHSGGDEADAVEYGQRRGFAPEDVYPENDTSRSLIHDPAVEAARPHFKIKEALRLRTREEWATAGLLTLPGPLAYNRMSHVMMFCDFVRIEAGHYGFRIRNSWRPWGAKNAHGVDGFAVYAWTPDSGFAIRQMTATNYRPATK